MASIGSQQQCAFCGKWGDQMFQCKGVSGPCRTFYCNSGCQQADWEHHKDICSGFRVSSTGELAQTEGFMASLAGKVMGATHSNASIIAHELGYLAEGRLKKTVKAADASMASTLASPLGGLKKYERAATVLKKLAELLKGGVGKGFGKASTHSPKLAEYSYTNLQAAVGKLDKELQNSDDAELEVVAGHMAVLFFQNATAKAKHEELGQALEEAIKLASN